MNSGSYVTDSAYGKHLQSWESDSAVLPATLATDAWEHEFKYDFADARTTGLLGDNMAIIGARSLQQKWLETLSKGDFLRTRDDIGGLG
jgi:hypothetical protein